MFTIYRKLTKAPTKNTHYTTIFQQQHEPARFTETTSPGVALQFSGLVYLLFPLQKCGKYQRHSCMGVQSDSRINTKTRNKSFLMKGWPLFINPPTMILQLSLSTVLVVTGKVHGRTKTVTSGWRTICHPPMNFKMREYIPSAMMQTSSDHNL